MAAAAVIQGDRENLPDGHSILFSVDFLNFAGRLPTSLYESFEFYCNASSTSWSLRVTFQRAPNDGSVSFLVVIQRTDECQIHVNVNIWMAAFPTNYRGIRPITFTLPQMPCGVQARRDFDSVIPYEVLRQLGDESLLFQVSFAIHGCHVDDDLKRLRKRRETRERESKALFSKI